MHESGRAFLFQQGQARSEGTAQVTVFLMVFPSRMITWGLLLSSVIGRRSPVFAQWLTCAHIRMFNEGMNLIVLMNTSPLRLNKRRYRAQLCHFCVASLLLAPHVLLDAVKQKAADCE